MLVKVFATSVGDCKRNTVKQLALVTCRHLLQTDFTFYHNQQHHMKGDDALAHRRTQPHPPEHAVNYYTAAVIAHRHACTFHRFLTTVLVCNWGVLMPSLLFIHNFPFSCSRNSYSTSFRKLSKHNLCKHLHSSKQLPCVSQT